MSYKTQATIRSSQSLLARISACAATQPNMTDVDNWASSNMWRFAAMPGWVDKWKYAIDSAEPGAVLDIGNEELVITDPDILSAVQAVIALPNQ